MVRVALVAALLGVLAISGCGDDADDAPPISIDGESSSPAETATTPPAPEPTTDDVTQADQEGNDVYARDVEAADSEQQAVAQAWVDYWRVRSASYGAAEVSDDLGTVATGDAVAQVIEYVDMLAAKGWHTDGDLIIDVSDIAVDGDDATLSSCMENGSLDRDDAGQPVEALVPYYDTTGTLVRADGAWRVSSLELRNGGPC